MPNFMVLSDEQLVLISKALADPRRFAILKQIGSKNHAVPCTELRECHPVSAATLSHHARELEMAGLIAVVKKGKFVDFVLRRDVLNAYTQHLTEI